LSGNIDFASASSTGTQLVNKGKTVSTTVGTSSTSVIKLTAVEDLGGGTKVTGHYGLDPRTLSNDSFGVTNNTGASGATAGKTLGNTATGLARDELFVGIAGAYGNIRLGAPNAMGLEVAGDASPLGTGVGSGYTGGGVSGTMMNSVVQTRYSRAIRYDSPAFSGLTASVLFAPGNDQAAVTPTTVTAGDSTALGIINGRKATEIALKYNNGPLNVSVANIKQAAMANKTGWYSGAQAAAVQAKETSATIAAVNYKIANTTLYAGYNSGDRLAVKSATDGSAAQSKGTRFAVKQTIGQFDLIAQQTKQKVSGVDTANDVTSKVTGLRADYNLSKTAAVYAGYEKFDTAKAYADVTAPTSTGDRKIVSIGLRKSF
jgi:predicted porin